MALALPPAVRRPKHKALASSVELQVTVHRDGSVTAVMTGTTGDSGYDRQIEAAYNQWKWRPAIMNDRPIETRTTAIFKVPDDG